MLTPDRTTENEPRFEVVWPLGRKAVGATACAQRLDDLNDKTVCEIWDGIFRGDSIFPRVREYLKAKYPRVKFVDSSHFGDFYGARDREVIADLPARLKESGADAAIVGIGA